MAGAVACAGGSGSEYSFHIDTENLPDIFRTVHADNPLTLEDRLHVSGGHFFTMGEDLKPGTDDDRRVRLLGINLTHPWLFPETVDDANRIARSISSLGFNAVRLIGVDSNSTRGKGSLFINGGKEGMKVDPVMMKGLTNLLDALGREGLYATLVLKSGYTFDPTVDCYMETDRQICVPDPGVVTARYPVASRIPSGSRVLDIFNSEMRYLEKQYIKNILTPLVSHPALALLELNNENSLLTLINRDKGWLPPLYAEEMDQRWSEWLLERYGSRRALLSAWSSTGQLLYEKNLLKDHKLEQLNGSKVSPWKLQQGGGHSAIRQGGLSLDPEKVYRLTISGKHGNGGGYSLSLFDGDASLPLTGQQRMRLSGTGEGKYMVCFRPSRTSSNAIMLLRSTHPTGILGSIDSVTLQQASRRQASILIEPGDNDSRIQAMRPHLTRTGQCPFPYRVYEDYLEFLTDTEAGYYSELKGWLRNEIGANQPVTGSQSNYSGLAGQYRAALEMDYLDIHYYWDHPKIPPANQEAWTMSNRAMVEDDQYGILPFMMANHVEGKPLVVSEMNTNHASAYTIDGYVITAAFAASQDIDGIYIFTLHRGSTELSEALRPGQLKHWYAVNGDSRVSSIIPLLANIFIRGDVDPSGLRCFVKVDSTMRKESALGGYALKPIHEAPGVSIQLDRYVNALVRGEPACQLRVQHLGDGETYPDYGAMSGAISPVRWQNATGGSRNYLLVNTEKTKVVAGHLPGSLILGTVSYRRESLPDEYGVFSLTSLDDLPIEDSRDLLVLNSGTGRNRNVAVTGSAGHYRACVIGKEGHCRYPFWAGQAGEFVQSSPELSVLLDSNVDDLVIDKLDERGQASGELKMEHALGGYEFMLNAADDRTPWYRIQPVR